MTRKYTPRIVESREYESPLGEFRVEAGLYIKDLAELAETNIGAVSAYQNGTISPIYERSSGSHFAGQWKSDALRIAEVLGDILKEKRELDDPSNRDIPIITIEDLFPRYACKFDFLRPTQEELLESTSGEDYGRITKSAEELYEERERSSRFRDIVRTSLNKSKNSLGGTSKKYWKILEQRFYYGKTLEDIGKQHNLSRSSINQIEKQALNRLRHPRIRNKLEEFRED